jgi:diguanylate cyclase (GGDEF)-like protein/PAS domain S-box-containing protein
MKLPLATKALISTSVTGGLCAVLIAGWRQSARGPIGESDWITAAVMGLLMTGTWVWPILVFRGGESEAFHMDEVFFTVLALLVPPVITLGTLGASTILAQAIRRRTVVKSAFNSGQQLTAAGLGLAVSRAIAAPSGSLTAAQVTTVLLGTAVYFVVNFCFVSTILVTMGASWRDFINDLSVQATLAGSGMLVGVVVGLGLRAHLWALALAVPGLILERRLVSSMFAAQYDRARMAGLYEVTLAANRGLRQQAVTETILESVRQLLRSPKAALAPAEPDASELATPMTVAGQRQWLVASGRRRDEPFDDADRGLLRALAAVGEGALSNAELYQQVRFEREKLASITTNIGEGVCAIAPDGKLAFVNPAAADMIELPPGVVASDDSTSPGNLAAPDFLLVPALEAMRTGHTIREDDARFRSRAGGTLPVAYTVSAVMSDGVSSGAVIAFRDITERKAFENKLHHHAFYDSLTGLANRRLLVERLDQAVQRSTLDRKTHALIFVDVDRFKGINDSLGHITGDEFLVGISSRMKATVRGGDLLARFGGDEFVVLLEDVAGVDEAVIAARRICAAVEQPMILPDGYEMVATVSLGIALTEPGKSADDVLRDADVAMYDAKAKGGGGYKVFDQVSMGTRSSERLQIEADLRKGLERDELEVHYQPFFSLDAMQIVGAEALIRWRHPTNGLMSPLRFIPMAEETGLILPIGRYVIEQACQQVRAIRDTLGVDLPISVNLSPRQFQESGLLSQVAAALDATGLPSESLIFEITESMVMEDLSGAREIMKKLNRLGVRLAIDDFGTGHSSLAYLKQFPVHEVKVDRAFVQGIADSRVDSAIVRAVIDLANAIGIEAVAEGVETTEQRDGLKLLGCHVGQGFFFSRPLQAEAFNELLGRQLAKDGRMTAGASALISRTRRH